MKNISRKKKMEREKGHVRKQENRGAGDTCHQQSKSKVTQKESRAEQGKTVWERERDSVPSASASARTFIPKSDLVSSTVSLSSLFLQKIPSFLPSFFCFSAVTEREREGLVYSTVLIIQSAATHLGILLIDWYWCVLLVSHSIFFLLIQIQTKLKIKPFLSLFLLNIFYWLKEWITK